MIKYDWLSIESRVTLQRANEFVQRYGHVRIDTEHLLLAMIEQARSPVPKLLEMLQVDSHTLIDRVILRLNASPRSGVNGKTLGKFELTEGVVEILNIAADEARRLEDKSILPEHLLLAAISQEETPVALFLINEGITRDRVFSALAKYRAEGKNNIIYEE